MKALKKITGFLLFTVVFMGCNSSTNTTTDPTLSGENFFTAKIDGADWSSLPETVAYSNPHGANSLTLQGSDSKATAITFNILNYTGIGTFDLTANIAQYVQGPTNANGSGSWVCNSTSSTVGSVTITSDNGSVIEGTIKFEGLNASDSSKKNITEGKFKAQKQ